MLVGCTHTGSEPLSRPTSYQLVAVNSVSLPARAGFFQVRADTSYVSCPAEIDAGSMELTPSGQTFSLGWHTSGSCFASTDFDSEYAGDYRADGSTIEFRVVTNGLAERFTGTVSGDDLDVSVGSLALTFRGVR